MKTAELLRFSAKRLAYLLDFVMLLLAPVYFFVPSAAGSIIGGFAFVLLFVLMILCLFIPRNDPQRFLPFLLGFGLFLMHSLLIVLSR